MGSGAAERAVVDTDEFERRLRGPAPRSGGDPLAELARLTGSAGADPHSLDQMFATRRPAGEQAREFDLSDFDVAGLRGSASPEGDAAAPTLSAHDRADHGYGGEIGEHDWKDDDFAPEPMQPARSKRPLYATAAVIAVGLLGIGGTFALKGKTPGSGELVEIRAASGPTKVPAQAAQNGTSASEASMLDRGAGGSPVTRVIDRQERPLDVRDAARSPRVISTSMNGSNTVSTLPADSEPSSPIVEPRKVKTVSVRPDGTIMGAPTLTGSATTTPLSSSATASSANTSPANPSSTATAATKGSTPKTATRAAATTPKAAADKPETTTRTAKADTPKPASPRSKPAREDADEETTNTPTTTTTRSGGGGFTVQLAAPGNEADAKATASKLSQKFSDALGGTRVTVQKADDKAVYRVRTASMSRDDAVAACEKVKAAGGSCFVAKN